jgi:hypothetical protein
MRWGGGELVGLGLEGEAGDFVRSMLA